MTTTGDGVLLGDVSQDMALIGARSLRDTMRWDNFSQRAEHCFKAMRAYALAPHPVGNETGKSCPLADPDVARLQSELAAMIAEVERLTAPLDADEGRKIVKALDAFGAEYGKASVYCIAARYIERQAARIAAQDEDMARLRKACVVSNDAICQTLGKALMYPWFKDDQKNFPGATEENGVCVGEHVAESLASEAATKLAALTSIPEDVEELACWHDRRADAWFDGDAMQKRYKGTAAALRAYAAREADRGRVDAMRAPYWVRTDGNGKGNWFVSWMEGDVWRDIALPAPDLAKLRRDVEAELEAALCAPDWPSSLGHVHAAVVALIDQQEDK